MSARSRQRMGDDVARSRAAILRLLAGLARGGWEDEDGRPVLPEVASDAAATLRHAWRAERGARNVARGKDWRALLAALDAALARAEAAERERDERGDAARLTIAATYRGARRAALEEAWREVHAALVETWDRCCAEGDGWPRMELRHVVGDALDPVMRRLLGREPPDDGPAPRGRSGCASCEGQRPSHDGPRLAGPGPAPWGCLVKSPVVGRSRPRGA